MPKRTKPAARPRRSWEDLESSTYVKGQTLPGTWNPEVYGKWFFDFLRCDLRVLTPGQLLGLRADLFALVSADLLVGKGADSDPMPPLKILETLQAFQQDARDGIERVRKGQWFELEDGIGYGIARMGNHIVRGNRRGSFRDLFRAAVMELVQSSWSQLHECPRCRAVFLKVGKQKYCSPACASRTHWDAFKARRPARDHHNEYANQTKKRTGPNVKVAIKPRRTK